ncbi:MAG: DUF4214 domain-containing protein [Desulfobulbaceae bacterium]|nr:DUF4214 domain-containing protein [Desulfobulbaceae bacterium]
MAIATTNDLITQLYVAYYDRAPDPEGLTYWANLYSNGTLTLAGIGENFAMDTEARSLYPFLKYPGILSSSDFITSLYTNMFNRAPDAEGLAYWQGQLTSGATSPGQMIIDIIYGAAANTSAQSVQDYATVENKVAVGIYYVTEFASSGDTWTSASDLSGATSIMGSVTYDTATIATGEAAVDAIITTAAETSGTTYTLTTGADSLTGTAGNDTFMATAATTSPTYTASDTMDGGAGTDILNLTLDTLGASAVPAGLTTGIETINVRNVSGNAQGIDAANFTGATSFNSNLSSTNALVTYSNLAQGQDVGVIGNGSVVNGANTFAYKATATSVNLNLSGGTDATNSTVIITGTGITSTVINSTGAANALTAVQTAATNTTLTINATTGFSAGTGITVGAETAYVITGSAATGTAATVASNGVDAAVQIGTVVATAKTIDASAMTAGGVATTLVAAVTSFKGGAGTDEVTTGTSLTATVASQIDAGAGTDTLIITATTDVDTALEAAQYANFEKLDVVAQTADVSLFTNSTFTGAMMGGNGTISNMTAAMAADVTIYANTSGTFGVTDAIVVGNMDTLNLTVSDGLVAKSTLTLANIAAAGVETINIVATDHVTVSALTGATAMTAMGISGAGNVSITTGALALNVNSAINASTVTGTVLVTAVAGTANGISITGSSTGVNTLTGSALADVLAGGSAADSLTAGDGADILTGGAGADTFNFVAGGLIGAVSSTNFETITDYATSSDIINDTGGALVIISGSTAASGTAAISAGALATFNAADSTLALRVIAVEAGINASGGNAARQFAFFESGSDSYVFVSDGTDGLDANDYLVKLTGVTGLTTADITTSAGDLILA